MMKLKVTKTFDEKYWICFEKEDVIKACKLNNCPDDLIKICIEEMKTGYDCTSCFITLVNELKKLPVYEKIK